MKRFCRILFFVLVGWLGLNRLARRTGVSSRDMASALPGDDLVQNPQMVMDRAGILDASAQAVWPWIVQLGKSRAGWYVPAWLEQLTRGSALSELGGLRQIEPKYQHLAVGDFVPEFGPGKPVFKIITLEPPYTLVYLSVRQPSANWAWPASEPPYPADVFQFSWALILEDLGPDRCRLWIRFRSKGKPNRFMGLLFPLAGLVDYLTIALMFAGLSERLAVQRAAFSAEIQL